MKTSHRLTAAQYDAMQLAALRPSRALEPFPHHIRGAARQSVLAALVANGYVAKCYLPMHIEYFLTDSGRTFFLSKDAFVAEPGSDVQPLIVARKPNEYLAAET
ncbi:hypothetical protein [Serpentinimonas maccroryi]|uniref:hypothetical protein n=1 Tax=Serpentinimonas maccroryi TaxID=1458426 RepID=UPI0020335B04|nr:hypothetical protein [Serpentinimonas maccroryi]MCM2479225.1 hypothetical protein [Serpentinimonas maccroryi]